MTTEAGEKSDKDGNETKSHNSLFFFFVPVAENYRTTSEHIISKLPLIRIYIYSYLKLCLLFFQSVQ